MKISAYLDEMIAKDNSKYKYRRKALASFLCNCFLMYR
jgi:hypothetical protein